MKYQPNVIRRQVRRQVTTPNVVIFKTRSFRNEHQTWHPVVNLETGEVCCDCPHFEFRLAKHNPSISTPDLWCKHVARAVQNCKRHGELDRVCSLCATPNADHLMADDNGEPLPGKFICHVCVVSIRFCNGMDDYTVEDTYIRNNLPLPSPVSALATASL